MNSSFRKKLPTACENKYFDNERPTKKMKPALPMDTVAILTDIGISKYQQGEHDKAEICFSQALRRVDIPFLCNQVDSKVVVSTNDMASHHDEHDSSAEVGTANAQHRSEYDEGMRVYEDPLPVMEPFHPDLVASTLYYNIAQTYVRRGLYKEAKTWFHRSLDKCTSISDAGSFQVVKILHCLGYCNYRTGKNKKDITYYEQALSFVSELQLGASHLAASLNCVGILHFNQHTSCSTDKAMHMFSQSLQLYRSCESPNLVSIATVLNNIGRVYYLRSEFKDALMIYEESLQLRKQLLGKDSVDVAATMYNIGQTCHQLGRLDESLAHYADFLKIARSAFGPNSRDVALVYKGIAEIYHERSDHKMALSYLNQALDTQRASRGGKFSKDVATTLNKLGNMCYEMKDYMSAMRHYQEGLHVERTVLTPNHPHIIVTLTNIAHIYKQLGEHTKALMTYKKVRKIQAKKSECQGGDSIQIAETLSSIGLMQYHMRDFESAFDSYQEALRIRRQHLGTDDHPDIASTLNSIGLVLFKQDMFELAKKCFSESLRIRSKILGKDHRDVAIIWYNIATIHFETGEDDLAVQMYKEALRVERDALGADHPDVVLTLQHLGQVHQQLGHTEQALSFFKEALDIERQREETESRALGRILNLLGNLYLQLGKTSEMMKCYVEASRIYEGNRESGETLVIAGYNFYGLSKTNPPCAPIA
jgi:tetratricopeptide (TPR) repeat protein